MTDQFMENLINTAAFGAIGIVMFVAAFFIVDMLTPGKLWDEICEKRNTSVAILMGCVALALGIIVAAAIH